MPERSELHIASATPRIAVAAGGESSPRGVDDAQHAERIARLNRRVEMLLVELAALEQRRRAGAPRAAELPPGMTNLAPLAPAHPAGGGFKRAPEAILAVIGLVCLWWFLPINLLSNLSPESTLGVIAAIPCLLVIFVFGGAAVWRIFYER